jgi:MFS family permease
MSRQFSHNPILRRLLQVDPPVEPLTEAELDAERERNYRWNFGVNMMDVVAFWFGLSFISAATIVPLFISKLTDSPIPIGIAALIAQGAWFLPQIFTANTVERLPRMKAVVVNLGLFLERLPMWLLVLSAIIAVRSPSLALIVFLIGYAWRGFGGGIVATSWQDLLARCFPVERRGRFMGISFFVGALTGALAAGFSAQFLSSFPYPANFAYVFTVAAIAISVSWIFLLLVREPVEPVRAPRRSNREYWGELPGILRRDDNYRHFLAGRLLLALSGMGLGFVTVAAIRRWDVADSTVGAYTAAILAGQMLANLSLGFLADKRGHIVSLELGALASLGPGGRMVFPGLRLVGLHRGRPSRLRDPRVNGILRGGEAADLHGPHQLKRRRGQHDRSPPWRLACPEGLQLALRRQRFHQPAGLDRLSLVGARAEGGEGHGAGSKGQGARSRSMSHSPWLVPHCAITQSG